MSAQAPAAAAVAHKRVADIAEQDCKRVCNPDVGRPFSSIENAFDRLLPYHILAEEDPEAADAREAAKLGGHLAASRADAWLAQLTRRAAAVQQAAWKADLKVEELEREAHHRSHLSLLMFNSYAAAEAQQELSMEHARRAEAAKAAKAAAEAANEVEAEALDAAAAQAAEQAEDATAAAVEQQQQAPPAPSAASTGAAAAAKSEPGTALPAQQQHQQQQQQQEGGPPKSEQRQQQPQQSAPPNPLQDPKPAQAAPAVNAEDEKRSRLLALTKKMINRR